MEHVAQQQQQPAILPQHVKNHPTTMIDVIGHTMEDIAVAKVRVVFIQQEQLVRLGQVGLVFY